MRVIYDMGVLYKLPLLRFYVSHIGRCLDKSRNLEAVFKTLMYKYNIKDITPEGLNKKLPETNLVLSDIIDNTLPKQITLEVVNMCMNTFGDNLETTALHRLQGESPILLFNKDSNVETAIKRLHDTFNQLPELSSLDDNKILYHHSVQPDTSRITTVLEHLKTIENLENVILNLIVPENITKETKNIYDSLLNDFIDSKKLTTRVEICNSKIQSEY